MSSYDSHHIVPRARCRQLKINPRFRGKVMRVRTGKHRAWHTLFGAQTPEEAIATIRREWSLSEEGQAEFRKLSGNLILMKTNGAVKTQRNAEKTAHRNAKGGTNK